jgi:hypothetical protein
MTSQLLNWYEEGTFTATLTSATPPTTPITTTAYYTRCGDTVTVYCAFRDVDTTGAAGNVSITGLPFTSKASVYPLGIGTNSRATTTNGVLAAVVPSSTTIVLVDFSGLDVAWASVGAGTYVSVQVTYKV